MDYAIGASVLPACSVGADHQRERIYFACDTDRYSEPIGAVDAEMAWVPRPHREPGGMVPKNGLSRDVVALSGFGNAIVPQVAAEVIRAYMELQP